MIEFMGKSLENPLIASSCIVTENVANILRLAHHGVQGAILKSCSDYSRSDVSGKREFAVQGDCTYASSPFEKEILTLGECLELLRELRSQTDILLLPSFTMTSLAPNDWLPACLQLEAAGADGIQLDFFYMENLIGTDGLSECIVTLLRELITSLHIPVMPKLNVNLPKDYIMPLLVRAGVEYVSLLDSVRSPYFVKTNDSYRLSERLDAEMTSCFGHWQLPLTLGYTYTAAKHGLKVCAGGGITCAEDVRKLLAAGAVTVQSATFLTKFPERGDNLIRR
jgi:dihydropyrimidine dehydrogenase (NAD+) subunit PreA